MRVVTWLWCGSGRDDRALVALLQPGVVGLGPWAAAAAEVLDEGPELLDGWESGSIREEIQ